MLARNLDFLMRKYTPSPMTADRSGSTNNTRDADGETEKGRACCRNGENVPRSRLRMAPLLLAEDVKCLVVCRGPVRKEAFDVFDEIGIREYGMLLSEKDSVVYPRCLALRSSARSAFSRQRPPRARLHGRRPGREARADREIIEIARATATPTSSRATDSWPRTPTSSRRSRLLDPAASSAPPAGVIRRAGAKDEAKKLARSLGNAVVPGSTTFPALALLAREGREDRKPPSKALRRARPRLSRGTTKSNSTRTPSAAAGGLRRQAIELVTIEELQKGCRERESRDDLGAYPGKRIRYKCIGGGGGKGQRVVTTARTRSPPRGDGHPRRTEGLEPGSNRNFLIELNLETTRHNEIQVVGNGEWSYLASAGRDCSIQMHEQKQLEFSLTDELLEVALPSDYDNPAQAANLSRDRETLAAMELDGASASARASASTTSRPSSASSRASTTSSWR